MVSRFAINLYYITNVNGASAGSGALVGVEVVVAIERAVVVIPRLLYIDLDGKRRTEVVFGTDTDDIGTGSGKAITRTHGEG